jgi:hypothetical protein
MTAHAPHTGRPLPAVLALGFAGTGATCLLARELLLAFCGNEAALAAALAVLPLALAAGSRLPGRRWPQRDPADLLGPALGILALLLPLSLLLPRLARPGIIAEGAAHLTPLAVAVAGLAAFVPLGLCLGCALALAGTVGERQADRSAARLPAFFAAAGVLGAFFIQFVAIPKLTPLNASLDMGLACCVAGILCAAGSPGGRGPETWMSVLALGFVLLLPVSGLIEARIAAWQWQCPLEAVPAVPAAAGSVLGGALHALATALACIAAAVAGILLLHGRNALPGKPHAPGRQLAAGMAEAGGLLGVLFAYQTVTGNLFAYLPLLVAAWMVGEALALYPAQDASPSLTPDVRALYGAALAIACLAALLAF